MGRFYKKAIVTALLVSALSTTAFCGARRCIYKYC